MVMASKSLTDEVVRNNPDIILAPDHGINYFLSRVASRRHVECDTAFSETVSCRLVLK